ncbi:MAG: tetratricopeptide repeat protein [Bacteroidia bacterium]
MLRSFVILFLLFVPARSLQGQQNNKLAFIDSLESVLRTHKSLNTEKVDLLNQLGYEYWIVDPRKSEEYGEEALEIAKILPYESGKAFANRVIGVSHWVRGNLDLAFSFLIDASDLYQEIGDSLGLANSMLNLGMAYADQQNQSVAAKKYQDALAIFSALEASSRVATTYTKIADLSIQKEDYDEAYEQLQNALAIHKDNAFLYGIAEANGKLGKIALARKDYNGAISYLLLAVEAGEKRNDQVGQADHFQAIGLAYLQKGDLNQADTYLRSSMAIADSFKLRKIQRDVYETFKDLAIRRGDFEEAYGFAERYVEIKEELFNEEKSNIIANMEAKQAFKAKEKELEIAQKNLDLLIQENKADNLLKVSLILGLLSIVAIIWGLLQRKTKLLEKNQKDLQKAANKTHELEETIIAKEQELVSYTFNFVQKNELISSLKAELKALKPDLNDNNRAKLDALGKKIDAALRVDKDWSDFRKHFESVHPQFIKRLNQEYPDLTKNEFKLIALLRLNLSSKEISAILGISPDSVKTARYRLRKKLGLNNQDDLFQFLLNYDQDK